MPKVKEIDITRWNETVKWPRTGVDIWPTAAIDAIAESQANFFA
jgi:hypothetical protein